MAEIDVFLGMEDQRRLAGVWLSEGALLVPDRDYDAPKYEQLRSLQEFDAARSEGVGLFYVVSDAFQNSPLEMRWQKQKGNYFIMPRNGGPAIEFFCGAFFTKNGIPCLAQSFIAYNSTYWDTLVNRNEKVPEKLKALYERVGRQLKAAASKIKAEKRTYYIGEEAGRLRSQGAKLVGVDL